MKNPIWVCVSKGEMVGIDNSSGGYPYRPTSTLFGVHFFNSLKEAQKYCDIWKKAEGDEDSYGFGDMHPAEFTYHLTATHRSEGKP